MNTSSAAHAVEPIGDFEVILETSPQPSHEEIALLAYEIWEANGHQHGTDQENWYTAEQLLTYPEITIESIDTKDITTDYNSN